MLYRSSSESDSATPDEADIPDQDAVLNDPVPHVSGSDPSDHSDGDDIDLTPVPPFVSSEEDEAELNNRHISMNVADDRHMAVTDDDIMWMSDNDISPPHSRDQSPIRAHPQVAVVPPSPSQFDQSVVMEDVTDEEDDFRQGHDSDTPASDNGGDGDDEEDDPGNRPLYVIGNHVGIGRRDSAMCVVGTAYSNNMSNQGTAETQSLVQMHMPGNLTLEKDMRKIKKILGFSPDWYQKNFFCPSCYAPPNPNELRCTNPDCEDKPRLQYFLVSDMQRQMGVVLGQPGMIDRVRAYATSNRNPHVKSDIIDGDSHKVYNDWARRAGRDELRLTLTLSIDGVSVFKSSRGQLYPVLAAINQIPPSERYKRENLIIVGLAQVNKQLSYDTFLTPILGKLDELFEDGIDIMIGRHRAVNVKCVMYLLTTDLKERYCMMCMTNHAGKSACIFCYNKGVQIKSNKTAATREPRSRTKNRGINSLRPCSADRHLRTDQGIRDSATDADLYADVNRVRKNHDGFLGYSTLLDHVHFRLEVIPIDYMHGTCLGVVKTLIEMWTDTNVVYTSQQRKQLINSIDHCYRKFKPTKYISRRTRSISLYKQFKASEFRTFLFYFGLTSLVGVIDNGKLGHFAQLVDAIYMLSTESVTEDDITHAEMLLNAFVTEYPDLYTNSSGEEANVTINIHNLLHLPMIVRAHGPLWAYSTFPFENFYGHMLKGVHGTGNVTGNVIWTDFIHKKCAISARHSKSEVVRDHLTMISRNFKDATATPTRDGVALGVSVAPEPREDAIVERLKGQAGLGHLNPGGATRNYGVVRRVIHEGVFFDSELAESTVKTRDTHKVKLSDDGIKENGFSYASIKFYVLDHKDKRVYACVKPLRECGRGIAGLCDWIIHLEDRYGISQTYSVIRVRMQFSILSYNSNLPLYNKLTICTFVSTEQKERS